MFLHSMNQIAYLSSTRCLTCLCDMARVPSPWVCPSAVYMSASMCRWRYCWARSFSLFRWVRRKTKDWWYGTWILSSLPLLSCLHLRLALVRARALSLLLKAALPHPLAFSCPQGVALWEKGACFCASWIALALSATRPHSWCSKHTFSMPPTPPALLRHFLYTC